MCVRLKERTSARLGIKDEVIALAVDLAADAVARIVDPDPIILLLKSFAGNKEEESYG
jgi:hypothetical protein